MVREWHKLWNTITAENESKYLNFRFSPKLEFNLFLVWIFFTRRSLGEICIPEASNLSNFLYNYLALGKSIFFFLYSPCCLLLF